MKIPSASLSCCQTPLLGLLLALGLCLGAAVPARVGAADLTTADGRRFDDCEVLQADALGIYIRHARGMARVLYEDLSDDLLAKLGPLPEIEEPVAEPAPATVPAAADAGAAGFQFSFQQRTIVRLPQPVYQPAFSYAPPCGLAAGPLRLANYPCRRMAERDFLITSGLVPRPWGVMTHQLPRGWRSYPRHWRRYY